MAVACIDASMLSSGGAAQALVGKERMKRGLMARRNTSKDLLGALDQHGHRKREHSATNLMKLQLRYAYSMNGSDSRSSLGGGQQAVSFLGRNLFAVIYPFSNVCIFWHIVLVLTCWTDLIFVPFWAGFGMLAQ